jgi:hypothetical protein
MKLGVSSGCHVGWVRVLRTVVIEIQAGRRRRGSEDAPER